MKKKTTREKSDNKSNNKAVIKIAMDPRTLKAIEASTRNSLAVIERQNEIINLLRLDLEALRKVLHVPLKSV